MLNTCVKNKIIAN